MFNPVATNWLQMFGRSCFCIYGKGRCETAWRIIEVHATDRRNVDSRWPSSFFRGTCITWTASVIAVGWDFAMEVLREQRREPASQEHPVEVAGGRIRDLERRTRAGAEPWASASEILAHECGHTWQARRLNWLYLPSGAVFTLWREGAKWYNQFENEASEVGLFGGIVSGSVSRELLERLQADDEG